MSIRKTEVLLVGCGKMGGALLAGWLKGKAITRAVVVDPGPGPDAFAGDDRVLAVRSGRDLPDGFAPAEFPWKINAWANINRAGNTNDMHTHAGSYWSGVYYVDDGGVEVGGALELMDPRGVLPMMYAPLVRIGIKGCLTAGASETFQPKTGNMVLFPAWLFHAVQPYLGDGVRISVAFNLGV